MILKGENRSIPTKFLCQRHYSQAQKKPANNCMTYSTALFLQLTRIYIYIYSLSSYLAEDTVFPSESPMSEWHICKTWKLLSRMRRNTKMHCVAGKIYSSYC